MTAIAPLPAGRGPITRPYPARSTGKGSTLLKMLRTTDPKDIAIPYLVTSFGFFLAGGAMALLMRGELTVLSGFLTPGGAADLGWFTYAPLHNLAHSLHSGERGDRVDGDPGPLAAAQRASAADGLDGLGGVREELPAQVRARVQGHDADGAGLDPAVTAAALPGGDPDLFPGKCAQPAQQRGLVGRRVCRAGNEDHQPRDGFTVLNSISSIGAFVLGASTLPFLWNVFKSYRYGRVVTVVDLWGFGSSLEWGPPRARCRSTTSRSCRGSARSARRSSCTTRTW